MISQPDDTNSLRLRVIVNLTVWCSGAGHHDISKLSRSAPGQVLNQVTQPSSGLVVLAGIWHVLQQDV